jgi:hypothetical protein
LYRYLRQRPLMAYRQVPQLPRITYLSVRI